MVLSILILFPLAVISFEDFKSREISLIWLAALSFLFILEYFLSPTTFFWTERLFNLLFIGFQLLALTSYFSVKKKEWVWIWYAGLGMGDIVFVMLLGFYLPFLNFLFFYISSLVCSLFFSLLFYIFNRRKMVKLPLAGFQAVLFGCLIIVSLLIKFDLKSDDWILSHIYCFYE